MITKSKAKNAPEGDPKFNPDNFPNYRKSSVVTRILKSPMAVVFFIKNILAPVRPFIQRMIASLMKLLAKITPQFIKNLNSNYKIAILITVVLAIWMGSGIIGKKPIQDIDVTNRVNNNTKSVLLKTFYISPTERIVRLSGKSKEARMVSIKAELSAQVEKIIASEGNEVENEFSILQLEEVEAVARLRQAQSQENRAQLEYSSQRRLLAQKLTSASSVAQAQADYEAAKAAASLALKQFDATKVQAPFAGRIENIYVEEGDFVQPGQLLVDIFDYAPLIIVGDLSELEVDYIKLDGTVVVHFITGEVVEGNVAYVAKNADEKSRTFNVQVEIPNYDNSLRAGVTAEMEFYTGLVNATKIPASIINIDDEGKLGVKGVDATNHVLFYRVDVVKAETNDMWVAGLPDGAQLITRGFGFVSTGEKVTAKLEEVN